MSNPNEPKNSGLEVRQESHNNVDGHTHTHVTRTSETVNNVPNPNVHQEGYLEGRVDENLRQGEVLAERDNENASRGLLTGILLTSLAALTAGAIWYFNQRDDVVPSTIVIPNSQPAPSPSPAAKQETTIIERTRDVPVPVLVPQKQAPAPQAPAPAPAPDIKIDNSVTQPPAAPESPAAKPAPTQPESQSSTDTQDMQSNPETTTPAESPSSQTEPTSGSNPTGTGSTGNSAQ